MRFLAVTETCDLAALYLGLAADGHEVKVSVSWEKAQGTLANMVQRTGDWRAELDWIRAAGEDGIVIFEAVSEGFGALQDALRSDGFAVIGGSAFGDRLENDRAFAQQILSELGLQVAVTEEFSDAGAAAGFIAARPGRYVLKFSGHGFDSHDNYVGRLADGSDVRAMLAARLRARGEAPTRFILMEHVEGVEMGVGAYFNGSDFLAPACLDWEHKRFFAGDMGELTGEMGTVATFDRSSLFFGRTLARLAPLLRANGHVGYVNLNTIVNERGIWPLELTCRFGCPGFAILAPLQEIGWAGLLRMMATRSGGTFAAARGFSVGIVLTTPPFPYSRLDVDEPVGLPVLLPDTFDAEDLRNLHYAEMGLEDGRLVTSGIYGWPMVVTGIGPTIAAAQRAAYARARQIVIPNVRYRLDIGDRLAAEDYSRVDALSLLADS
jgi:phosphoribosylamine--glycine ligase